MAYSEETEHVIAELQDGLAEAARELDEAMADRDRHRDEFRWRSIAEEPPREGQDVIASDGSARWMDRYQGAALLGFRGKIATHWHPIRSVEDIPIKF